MKNKKAIFYIVNFPDGLIGVFRSSDENHILNKHKLIDETENRSKKRYLFKYCNEIEIFKKIDHNLYDETDFINTFLRMIEEYDEQK